MPPGMLTIDAVFDVVLLKGKKALFGCDGYLIIPLLVPPLSMELKEI